MKVLKNLFFVLFVIIFFVDCTYDSAYTFCVMNDSVMTALRDSALQSFLKSDFKIKSSQVKLLKDISTDNMIIYSDTGTISCTINEIGSDYAYKMQEHINFTKRITLSDDKFLITGWEIDTLRLWQGPLNIYLVENNIKKTPYGSYGLYKEKEKAIEANAYSNHNYSYGSNKGQAVIKEECLAAASESDFSELNRVSNRGDKEALADLISEGKVYVLQRGESGYILERGYGKVCISIENKTVWVSSEFVDY